MKKKISIKKIIALILFAFHPLVFIYLLKMITDHPIYVAIAMFASILFMVITHELGHLIFGLLTGYKFISFRIFSLMLLRENGKFKLKKQKVPGTAGQCLMAPPKKKNGSYPYKLYNLGGIFVCGTLSLIPIVISLFFMDHVLGLPLFVFGAVAFMMNLMNAIPTGGKGMMNDATNLRMANESIAGREALWNQLEYIHLISQNVRTADMPPEMFFYPMQQDLGNTLVQWQVTANAERCEDMGFYEKAKEAVDDILQNAPFLPPLYEDYFKTEVIFLGTLLDTDAQRIAAYEKDLQKRHLLKNSVNFARAEYAYLLFSQKDAEAIDAARKNYEKKIEKEPYEASRHFEKRQMAYIDALAKSRISSREGE